MTKQPRSPHVLACARGDDHDLALLAHTRHLATALGCPWSVLYLGPAGQTEPRAELKSTLAAAAGAGVRIEHRTVIASSEGLERDALAASVAVAARDHAATVVLIAPPPSSKKPWYSPSASSGPFTQQLRRALPDVTVHVIDPASTGPAGRPRGATSEWRYASTALAVLALCTLIGWMLAPYYEPANPIMVYLAGVVYVALRTSRPAALLTVVGSVVLYDLLFIAPSGSIKPSEPHYVLISVVMLLVGFIISHLASRSRQQAAMADSRAQRAQALNLLALDLVEARTPTSIGAALAHAMHRTLGVSAQLLPVDGAGNLSAGTDHFAEQLRLARTAVEWRCDTGAGTTVEAEAAYRCLPLLGAHGPLGVVGVDLLAREHDTQEDQQLLKAAANQVAVALDRAVFEKLSAREAVQAERERMRNTLLTGISHDFRTPLTTIVGAATSLLEQGHAIDAEQRATLLRNVLTEARRMNALTSNLLDLTRMQEGAIVPNFEWCPADELVDEALSALSTRLVAHTVKVQTPKDAVVWCDARLLGQLLVNLLDNATRHAPCSTISIAVTAATNSWQLVVQDDGPGVPQGQEREVFAKFFRGKSDSSSSGTGLGLAICAAVAHLHGGTLAASAGPGARFTLTLPQPALKANDLTEVE